MEQTAVVWKKKLGFVALGRELSGQQPEPCAEFLSCTTDTIFLEEELVLPYRISLGECNSPAFWTPCSPTLWTSHPAELPGLGC